MSYLYFFLLLRLFILLLIIISVSVEFCKNKIVKTSLEKREKKKSSVGSFLISASVSVFIYLYVRVWL
jgi:hypothetical protein